MVGVRAARDACWCPVACVRSVKLTSTVSTTVNSDAQVLNVSVSLTFHASNGDADVLPYCNQVVDDSNAACQKTVSCVRIGARYL